MEPSPVYAGPKPPIPEPLRGSDEETFAYPTLQTRLGNIARRVLVENQFPPVLVERVETLIADLPHGAVRYLEDGDAPDETDWRSYVAPHIGLAWIQTPWFFAEAYFYRRLLEATGYFSAGPGQGVDPFELQKRLGLDASQEAISGLCARLETWQQQDHPLEEALDSLIRANLWSNQIDLSMWPVDAGERSEHPGNHPGGSHLLIDEVASILAYLSGEVVLGGRVDILVDNAGFELVSDLALADLLLGRRIAGAVQLHLKAHPVYVSDAMVKDVQATLDFLAARKESGVRRLAGRLRSNLSAGRLLLQDDFFWNSPLSLWEMPASLRALLAESILLISKGDANYRRMVGDRFWPFDTPFRDILRYSPVPLAALRAVKSDVLTGLLPGQVEALSEEQPGWMISGRWAVVQFYAGNSG